MRECQGEGGQLAAGEDGAVNVRFARTLVAMAVLALAGCAAPRVDVRTVSVPVPVPCNEPVPARPHMPTMGLVPPVTLDAFAAAAMAEIERREGWELELVAALEACRAPIAVKPAGGLGFKLPFLKTRRWQSGT